MKKLVAVSKIISSSAGKTAVVLFVLLTCFIAADLYLEMIPGMDWGNTSSAAGILGGTGLLLLLSAFGFYPYRRIFLLMKKKNIIHGNGNLSRCVLIWSNLHPVLAIAGTFLIILHGYIFMRLYSGSGFNLIITAGVAAAVILLMLMISGMIIHRNKVNRTVRRFHDVSVVVFLVFVICHRLFEMLDINIFNQ